MWQRPENNRKDEQNKDLKKKKNDKTGTCLARLKKERIQNQKTKRRHYNLYHRNAKCHKNYYEQLYLTNGIT